MAQFSAHTTAVIGRARKRIFYTFRAMAKRCMAHCCPRFSAPAAAVSAALATAARCKNGMRRLAANGKVFGHCKTALSTSRPDEHWAAAISYSGRLTLDMLDLTRTPKVDSKYPLPPDEHYFFRHHQTTMSQIPTTLAFAPSSPTLAVWDGSSEVELHSVPHGEMQKTLTFTTAPSPPTAPGAPGGFGAPVYSSTSLPAALAWSPDGKWLAACNGTQLQIWDIENGQTQSALLPAKVATPGMTGRTPILSWSHDGRQLATGGDAVGLWSAPDLKLQRQFRAQGGVAFSSDGRMLATGGFEAEHAVLLWPLKIWPF